jgi:hypothetical protein
VLEPIRDDVVMIGAVAVQVALDGQDVTLTPTRDIDASIATEAAQRVVERSRAPAGVWPGSQRTGARARRDGWVFGNVLGLLV